MCKILQITHLIEATKDPRGNVKLESLSISAARNSEDPCNYYRISYICSPTCSVDYRTAERVWRSCCSGDVDPLGLVARRLRPQWKMRHLPLCEQASTHPVEIKG
jgi:hypothetical protein